MTNYAEQRYGQHQARLGTPHAWYTDAAFHASQSMLRTWLALVESALRDEPLDEQVVRRVLDKLIYATVSPSEVFRIAMDEGGLAERAERLEREWPPPAPMAERRTERATDG